MRWHNKVHWANVVIMPYFPACGQPIDKILRFNGFQNGGRPPSWISKKIEISTADRVNRINVNQNARFRGDMSNRYWNLAICLFSKWRLSPSSIFKILKFSLPIRFGGPISVSPSPCQILCWSVKPFRRYGRLKFEILTAGPIWRVNMRHHVAAVRHLGFVFCLFGPPTKSTW